MVPHGFIALHHKGFGQKSPSKLVYLEDPGKSSNLIRELHILEVTHYWARTTFLTHSQSDICWQLQRTRATSLLHPKPFAWGNQCAQNYMLLFYL